MVVTGSSSLIGANDASVVGARVIMKTASFVRNSSNCRWGLTEVTWLLRRSRVKRRRAKRKQLRRRVRSAPVHEWFEYLSKLRLMPLAIRAASLPSSLRCWQTPAWSYPDPSLRSFSSIGSPSGPGRCLRNHTSSRSATSRSRPHDLRTTRFCD